MASGEAAVSPRTRKERVEEMRDRIVTRFELRTQSRTAGAHNQLIEAILEELYETMPALVPDRAT